MQVEPDILYELPVADPASAAHSEAVAAFIRQKISEAGGSIGFDQYMHHALYAPGLGYYAAGSSKFGAEGDFVTAPELSPIFSHVLARQCADLLSGAPSFSVLELGAGSGVLALHLLRRLGESAAMPRKYQILEPSADLQARQKSLLSSELAEESHVVEWIDDWPQNFVGIVIANEVMDALPVARFVMRGEAVRELRVSSGGNKFVWTEHDATNSLHLAVRQIENDIGMRLPDGYVSEVCLALQPWIADLANCISKGFVFLFDYGVSRREFYAPERRRGWLRCHFRHRAHDNPFIYPGIQDLTSWVDFSAVAAAAASNGLTVAGYTTQAMFLLNGGLAAEFENFSALPPTHQAELSRQVKLLTLPGEMGENFKCIGLCKGNVNEAAVFAQSDKAHAL